MRRRTKEKKEYRDALAEQVQPHLDTEAHSICSIHMYVVYVCTDIHIPTSQILHTQKFLHTQEVIRYLSATIRPLSYLLYMYIDTFVST